MASKKAAVQVSKQAIAAVRRDIFGELPNLNMRTGNKVLKRPHRGTYLARYYQDPIEPAARKTFPGYKSELEERRLEKLQLLRRRGKGPPKKGSGKRQQKK